jgi:hypothetical protein
MNTAVSSHAKDIGQVGESLRENLDLRLSAPRIRRDVPLDLLPGELAQAAGCRGLERPLSPMNCLAS